MPCRVRQWKLQNYPPSNPCVPTCVCTAASQDVRVRACADIRGGLHVGPRQQGARHGAALLLWRRHRPQRAAPVPGTPHTCLLSLTDYSSILIILQSKVALFWRRHRAQRAAAVPGAELCAECFQLLVGADALRRTNSRVSIRWQQRKLQDSQLIEYGGGAAAATLG